MNTEILEAFIAKTSNKKKIVVIYWPTGSGKTSLSIDIAKYLDSEIVSTDSRQIFKHMDIGTGKITAEEMDGVPHHMLDIITPDISYSVWEFQTASKLIINELHRKNKIPLLVWGTGLYIDSLIYDFKVKGIPANLDLRNKLESQSAEEIYKQLQEIDPEYAKELHPNNKQYVIRALEVKLLSGKSKRDFREEKSLIYDVLFLTPDYGDRENLYNRINTRVEQMFTQGLEEEIQSLLKMWYSERDFGMKSIGYSEFFPYLRGEYDKAECIRMIQQPSRNYAKRQCTWFRKYTEK